MFKQVMAVLLAAGMVQLSAVAAPAAADSKAPAQKICKKTGKACTGKKDAAHNCKTGDKECSKDVKAAAHKCGKGDKKCAPKTAVAHKCGKGKKNADGKAICEKTGKVCTGGKNAAHNCKAGDKECSKAQKPSAKK